MTDGQFHGALKTGDTQGKRFTDDQWRAVLKEVWRKRGQVYGKVLSKVNNGYTVDLLGTQAFMYNGDAHPDTEHYINQQMVFEIKQYETTIYRGRPQTNIIVTNDT